MKKLTFLILILLASKNSLAEPAYKISDNDIKMVINTMNKYEQCIYPEIRAANGDPEKLELIYSKMNEGSTLTVSDMFELFLKTTVLPEIIGENNTEILFSDQESLKFYNEKYQIFNHSNPADRMNDSELARCLELKLSIDRLKAQEKLLKLKQESRSKKIIDCNDPLYKLTYTCRRKENNQ